MKYYLRFYYLMTLFNSKMHKYKSNIKPLLSYPFPRPLLMSTSFSMPPLSAKALAFSMLRLVTSCSVQQTDATVSSDSMVGLPPGRRFTRSRMAYFPAGAETAIRSQKPFCLCKDSSSVLGFSVSKCLLLIVLSQSACFLRPIKGLNNVCKLICTVP